MSQRETSPAPTAARPAATIVVARPDPTAPSGVRVLVVRRSAVSPFAPGFVVFPGGVIDEIDAELTRRWFGTGREVARACAVRELAEETGLVVTAAGLVEAPGRLPGDDGLPPPDVTMIPEMARWVAPDFLPVRFDARFFAVAAPLGLTPRPDGIETDAAWWASPHEILERAATGEVKLMWPTRRTLEALARCRSVEDVMALRVRPSPPPVPGPSSSLT